MAFRRVSPREDRRTAGMLLIIMAVTSFTGIDSSAKWLVVSLSPVEIVFVRYFGHFLFVLLFGLRSHGLSIAHTEAPRREIWRAVLLLAGTLLNFMAVKFLPLSMTAAIFFTIPLIVASLSMPLLREHVGLRRWGAILVGLLGILIVIRPGFAGFHWAALLSVGAAVCAALYTIETRHLAGVDASFTQQFYAALVASVLIAPFAISGWQWPHGALNWAVFITIGFWGWFGHQMLTVAYRFAPAAVLTPYNYFQIIPMTLAGYLIFANKPDIWVLLGSAIVVASGLYIWLRKRKRQLD